MKHRIERIKINGKIVAIRAVIQTSHKGIYSKQFVVSENMAEAAALKSAREYVAMVRESQNRMPDDEQVIKVAEDIVDTERKREAHNQTVRNAAVKDVTTVLKRYASTNVFGYFNTSGDWTK